MIQLSLDDMAKEIHETAIEKGFWPDKVDDLFISKQLLMIVSEVVEATEAIRKDEGKQRVADEIADIIIRTLDLYQGLKDNGYVDQELQVALNNKANFNKTRPERHGVKF
jgi:NTP pyrophosphatase (non-canonical NTP hydrolase)